MLQGGVGGNGEGPQFQIQALEMGNVLVNGNAYYYCSSMSMVNMPNDRGELVQWQRRTQFIMPIVGRLSEYIEHDRNNALSVAVYCVAFVLLAPGPLSLINRLRLAPLTALSVLAIPRMLFMHNTITLVDVTGEGRLISLDLWRNPAAFMKNLQDLFVCNREITTIIRSNSYRIQNSECSVYRLGSPLVTAGTQIFMAAILYRPFARNMTCPWCNAQIPVAPGHNFQTSIDCTVCGRRFSTSQSAAEDYSNPHPRTPYSESTSNHSTEEGNSITNSNRAKSPTTRLPKSANFTLPQPSRASPHMAGQESQEITSLRFVHLQMLLTSCKASGEVKYPTNQYRPWKRLSQKFFEKLKRRNRRALNR
ncbi:hypothetical protein R3P38DRAFT_3101870 [Favolaschia claudopus]|uniref:C2H2-type domain-containing protein n=1 Tax=Favolaschia claudopus TaxID=2862362 RepID=A0AAV9ZNE0_9AGAR